MGKKKTAEDYNREWKGKVFGEVEVGEYSHNDKHGHVYFWCTCLRCGVRFGPVKLQHLKSGNTTSCGHCLERTEIGKRYNHWVIKEFHHKSKNRASYFLCECDCGKEGIIQLASLRYGSTTSCGHCLERTEIGKRYGRYIIKEFHHRDNRNIYFLCECDCGNDKVVRLDHLKYGDATSCGCRSESVGEEKIRTMLEDLEVKFEQEYAGFTDMKDKGILRCDFWLPGFNRVIEFDGELHYQERKDFSDKLENTQRRDQIKNQYCWDHNIDIVRIPYWEIDNIDYNDLVSKYSRFLVKENECK